MVANTTDHVVSAVTLQPYRAASTAVRAARDSDFSQEQVGRMAGPNEAEPSTANLARTAADLNRIVQNVQRNLQFSVDDPSGATVIRVVDTVTGQTIRQIPSVEALALAEHLKSVTDADTNGLLIESNA